MGKAKEKRVPKGFEALAGLCQAFVGARKRVSEQVEKIRERKIKYTKRLMPGLCDRVAERGEARDRVREYLGEHRDQFSRPRTRALAGCRVGWRKKPGRLVIPDAARTIELIREKLPASQQAVLLCTTTKIVKPALKKLSAAELASVGASIVAVDDEPVIAVPKDSLNALVDAPAGRLRGGGMNRVPTEIERWGQQLSHPFILTISMIGIDRGRFPLCWSVRREETTKGSILTSPVRAARKSLCEQGGCPARRSVRTSPTGIR